MVIFSFFLRDLHTDVQVLKSGKPNGDIPSYTEIQSAFKYVFIRLNILLFIVFSSFNHQPNNVLQLTDFLNSVGQLKYRGTSVLFRLPATTQELLIMSKSVFLMKIISFIHIKDF
jgi:hypothetical protein